MSDNKLSKELRQLHDSGDTGMMVEGFPEQAEALEQIIKQQQTRISELEQCAEEAEGKLSIVLDQHGHPDSYKCIVYDLTPLETEKKLQDSIKRLGWLPPDEATALRQERNELAATVERLRQGFSDLQSCSLNSEYNKTLSKIRVIFNTTPQQNLNSVKREAFIEGGMTFRVFHSPHEIKKEANTKYPSNKDGE